MNKTFSIETGRKYDFYQVIECTESKREGILVTFNCIDESRKMKFHVSVPDFELGDSDLKVDILESYVKGNFTTGLLN